MALHYNLSKIKDRHEQYPPTEDGYLNRITESLIFTTMSVGIGEITAATAAEFYARAVLVARINGFEAPSLVDVHAHIGLKTNVFPMESRPAWLKRYVGYALDGSKREFTQVFPEPKPVRTASQRKPKGASA